MQYYDLRAKKTSKMEKEFGKTLVVSTFIDTIYEFLNGASDPTIPNYIATKLLPRLKEIQEYFKVQREFCFYSSKSSFNLLFNCCENSMELQLCGDMI